MKVVNAISIKISALNTFIVLFDRRRSENQTFPVSGKTERFLYLEFDIQKFFCK